MHLACATALMVQLWSVLAAFIHPTLTNTSQREVNLRDTSFPLALRICVIPGFKREALVEAGYKNLGQYFKGQSRFNRSILGWGGHTAAGGSVDTPSAVLARVRRHTEEDVVNEMGLRTMTNEGITMNLTRLVLERVNFPHNCYTLDLANMTEVREKGVARVWLDFNTSVIGEGSVEVHLQDSSLMTTAEALYTSDPVRFQPRTHTTYSVKIKAGTTFKMVKLVFPGDCLCGGRCIEELHEVSWWRVWQLQGVQ